MYFIRFKPPFFSRIPYGKRQFCEFVTVLLFDIDKYPCQCYITDDKDSCQTDIDSCQEGGTAMPLGNRLKELRAAKGLNQQELGTLVGASRQTISLIERGDYNPSITLALRIAKVFEKPVEEVFYLTEEEQA